MEGGFLPAWRAAQNPPAVTSIAAPAVRAPPHHPLCKDGLVEPKAPHRSSTTGGRRGGRGTVFLHQLTPQS